MKKVMLNISCSTRKIMEPKTKTIKISKTNKKQLTISEELHIITNPQLQQQEIDSELEEFPIVT